MCGALSMLDKPLDQITFADLKELIQQRWPEGKAVDYKRDMYGRGDSEKKELLKDLSSFANTDGGDIIIGVDETAGLPTGIPGVVTSDADAERLRLEEVIRRGIEPRIDFAIDSARELSVTGVGRYFQSRVVR
jgi:predicted HTH transcriptional regulator